jgi:hypothetical protein
VSQSPREIVTRALRFEGPERVPRDLWVLPWAESRYPDVLAEIRRRFPTDFTTVQYFYPPSSRVKGDPYRAGTFTDEWGCIFRNLQDGIIGEVETPILADLSDWRSVHSPYEQLPTDTRRPYEQIRRFYEATDKFVMANCCPRPWERYQFLRGTQNALMDVMMPEAGARDLLGRIHDFYLKELEFWVRADVDAVMFMDDWGAQSQLLIPPEQWRALFKPIYKDYCDLAEAHGKFSFMHSDGHISEIYADLIEVGVNALNSQLFCMDLDDLARRAKGKITFWGEIDRQHVLPSTDPQVGRDAVARVASHLYDPAGGIIAQFEFGVGAHPDTALVIFDEWMEWEAEFRRARGKD